MPGLIAILLFTALIGTLVHAYNGKVPLWVSVLLVIIAELLRVWPK